MNLLIEHFRKFVSIASSEEEDILSYFELIKVPKKSFLLKKGDICESSFFITEGCVKFYSLDNSGVEHIILFGPENWWITDMYSLLSEIPSELFIESILPTSYYQITRKKQLQLLENFPKLEKHFRILLENHTISNHKRIRQNMELTAKERYEIFCNRYPSLIQTIPQKLIASYLGVTPEFLSKLRGMY
jgi:CRP-like cAMP-binding protein